MTSTANLAQWAFTLELDSLTQALRPGISVDGLLLAAASAHDPDPRLQEAVIRLLLRHGSKVNVEIIGLLLAHGADRTIKNKAGKTAREYVHRPEVLALL